MADLSTLFAPLGTGLQTVLMSDDIVEGATPGYETCKLIYQFHPLGAKIVEKPIEIAQSQKREITVANAPGDMVREEFETWWDKVLATEHIKNFAATARMYGIGSIGCIEEGVTNEKPLELPTIYKRKIAFNTYDPLNTAGSLVLNQNPLAMDFQHVTAIRVQGSTFHPSRTCVLMNERPIYISYTPSAFGFVGRSVYQRALFPLKTFIATMRTDYMVALKAGVLVAKMEQPGAFVDKIQQYLYFLKRAVVKQASTGMVIGIGTKGEEIETLNMQNLEGPFGMARKNSIENIASGVPMPAKMLTEENLAEAFGEGTEEAKAIARHVDGVRRWLQPGYDYFDKIVMRLAWTPDFYERVKVRYPDWMGTLDFDGAFYKWANSFKAVWPSLLTEPDSELAKSDKVKLEALISVLEVLMPKLDPDNLATVVAWICDNMNEMDRLFSSPLNLDLEALAAYEPPMAEMGSGFGEEPAPKKPKTLTMADSAPAAIDALKKAANSPRLVLAR